MFSNASESIKELQHLDGAAASASSHQPRSSLESMLYELRHGSVEAGLFKESKEMVFYLANDDLGKPIMIFPGTMSTLFKEALPEVYAVYDAHVANEENMEDQVILSKTLVKS
jgi:hypothetical protein